MGIVDVVTSTGLTGFFADLHSCRDLSGAQPLDSAELEDNPAALG